MLSQVKTRSRSISKPISKPRSKPISKPRSKPRYPDLESPIPVADAPFKLSKATQNEIQRAPLLGEHTAEILQNLGLSDPEIEDLKSNNVI